jgi:short-subunit dehydrogenase
MQIEGSVALVTRANRGIGAAFAQALLARGAAKVYAGVRDLATITDGRLITLPLDVTDPEQPADAARAATDVEIVVNNAGGGHFNTALSASLDEARFDVELNYVSLVSMTQAFAPVLAANGGGALVNMLSVASWVAFPQIATYAASKAAAWSYTNAARTLLSPAGTEVLGVHVGFVDTDLIESLDVEKVAPLVVAEVALDALEAGESEVLVDDLARSV